MIIFKLISVRFKQNLESEYSKFYFKGQNKKKFEKLYRYIYIYIYFASSLGLFETLGWLSVTPD